MRLQGDEGGGGVNSRGKRGELVPMGRNTDLKSDMPERGLYISPVKELWVSFGSQSGGSWRLKELGELEEVIAESGDAVPEVGD